MSNFTEVDVSRLTKMLRAGDNLLMPDQARRLLEQGVTLPPLPEFDLDAIALRPNEKWGSWEGPVVLPAERDALVAAVRAALILRQKDTVADNVGAERLRALDKALAPFKNTNNA